MEKILKISTWLFTLLALVFLWLSLRSETDQMFYGMIALGIWGLGMLANYFLKKQRGDS